MAELKFGGGSGGPRPSRGPRSHAGKGDSSLPRAHARRGNCGFSTLWSASPRPLVPSHSPWKGFPKNRPPKSRQQINESTAAVLLLLLLFLAAAAAAAVARAGGSRCRAAPPRGPEAWEEQAAWAARLLRRPSSKKRAPPRQCKHPNPVLTSPASSSPPVLEPPPPRAEPVDAELRRLGQEGPVSSRAATALRALVFGQNWRGRPPAPMEVSSSARLLRMRHLLLPPLLHRWCPS
uniref:Uncharacterized protein n=3 Tax=Oryza sativa subsp. japonica TaxID=39947 RepID=Q75GL3_ORYSJ|nr:uncharacterized protein LOC112938253 [Oryza sativa Japonica Group]AAS07286.1 hypothetical protein [Oryza sativa Japonica Group]